MRSLGSNGRFGNQIFQYAFLRFYARAHGFQYQVPHWPGQHIFGLNDPVVDITLPRVEVASRADLVHACAKEPIFDADFWGYFQEAEYFSSDKPFFYELFQPVPVLASYLNQCWAPLLGHEVIGLHLRYGDYGYGYFFETPLPWVIAELKRRWHTYVSPVLYLATDDPRVRRALKCFSPILCADIFPDAGSENCPEFYADFWALSKVDSLLMIANSSFSFAAAMLNDRCQEMLRPSIYRKGFVELDPWSGPALLKEVTPWLDLMQRNLGFLRLSNWIRRGFLFSDIGRYWL